MRKTTFACVWLGLIACLPVGCEVNYYAHLVIGEAHSLGSTIPIEDALVDPRLTDQERAKLAAVQQVRQFGIERIGLVAGTAYTVFEANGSEPAAYVLTASAKDSLTPYRWDFAFLGRSEVKGFFDRQMGQCEADRLAAAGYDVFYGQADGFSTLGWLPDPIRQSNLRLDLIDLAELILHEMTHSTVFKPSDMDFNESLATFVGRAAAQRWFEEAFGAESTEASAARARFADKAVIDEYVNELFAEMTQYYEEAAARGEARETIIAGREAHFTAASARFVDVYRPQLNDVDRWGRIGETPMDNARLLAAIRYQGTLSDYQVILDKVGGDFSAALTVFREAASRPDSRGFLRTWPAGP